MKQMRSIFCGRRSYPFMLQLQEDLHKQMVLHQKQMQRQNVGCTIPDGLETEVALTPMSDTVLAVEHSEPVYTMGRRNTSDGLPAALEGGTRLPVVHTRRGGGITWHGPGQLTVYPIANIQKWWSASEGTAKGKSPIRWYSTVLEDAMRGAVTHYGVPCESGCVGVWVPPMASCVDDGRKANKIGSIGLQFSDWVSMHGIGLNVSNDIVHFDRIVMCELPGRRATSLHAEMQRRGLGGTTASLPSVHEVWPHFHQRLCDALMIPKLQPEHVDASALTDEALRGLVLRRLPS